MTNLISSLNPMMKKKESNFPKKKKKLLKKSKKNVLMTEPQDLPMLNHLLLKTSLKLPKCLPISSEEEEMIKLKMTVVVPKIPKLKLKQINQRTSVPSV